jgi:hypothetical protein
MIGNRAFGSLMAGRAPRARVADRRLQRAVGVVYSAPVKDIRSAQDKAEVDEIADQLVREGKGPRYNLYTDTSYRLAPDTEEHLVGHGNLDQLDRLRASDLAEEISKRIPVDQRGRRYRIKIYACHVGKEPAGLAATASLLLRVTHRDLQITAAAGFLHKTGGLGPIQPPPGGPLPYTGPTYHPERDKEYVLEKYTHGSGALDKVEKDSYRLAAMDFLKSDALEQLDGMKPGDVDRLMELLNPGKQVMKTYGPASLRERLAMVRGVLERLADVPIAKEERFIKELVPLVPDGKARYERRLNDWARYFWYRKAKLIETEMRADAQIVDQPWRTYTGAPPAVAAAGPRLMGGLQGAPLPRRPGVADDEDD